MSQSGCSIIIPAHNAARTLRDALVSLAGDTRIHEIVVVDDASSDGTAQVAERAAAELALPVVLVEIEGSPLGPSAARNRGIDAATSDVIGFLDADDVWVAPFPASCAIALQQGAMAAIGRTANVVATELGAWELLGEPVHMYVPSAGLVQRSALAEVGGFDESLKRGEDLDLFLRLADAGIEVTLVDDVILEYRHRPGTASSSVTGRQEGLLAALGRRVERQRRDLTLSVIMPTLNAATYLDDALRSITGQVPAPHEVLLIDGSSSDATLEIAASFPQVTIVHQASSGVHAAHNEGLERAAGDVVAFCGADDLVQPGAFAAHLSALASRPDADVSVGLTRFFADGDGHAGTIREGIIGSVRRARCLEAVAVRRSVVSRYGGFLEELGPGADVEWNQRLVAKGAVIVEVDAIVVDKRIHHDNTTYAAGADAQERLLGALRASIVRGRGAT